MRDRLYLALFNLFRQMVLHTPKKIQRLFIRGLARLIHALDARHRHIARVNLDLAFGETMPDAQKERIIEKTYENLLFNLADFVRNQGISREELMGKLRFENAQIVDEAKRSGRPIVFITAHYGNWELISLAMAARFGPLSVVGRPLDSPVMDEILRRNREQFDIEMIPKKGAMKSLIKALKSGRNVGLLVDQNTAENEGLLIDFFGKEARHTPAAAILAKRMDAVVIPAFITTGDRETYTVTVYPPLEIDQRLEKEEAIAKNVQAQAKVTEEAIRKKPDEWFWLHQRWKNRYEHLYRRDK
ncbi:lipid A biosynthesis lauroyl acyltransferase [Hydrogenimonas sp.]